MVTLSVRVYRSRNGRSSSLSVADRLCCADDELEPLAQFVPDRVRDSQHFHVTDWSPMMTHSCLALCACALMLHTVSGQLPQRPSEQLDLTGHWTLNPSMSDVLPLLPGESMTMARASGVVPA